MMKRLIAIVAILAVSATSLGSEWEWSGGMPSHNESGRYEWCGGTIDIALRDAEASTSIVPILMNHIRRR